MTYLYSFLFCGIICLISQVILDNTKLTPGHITSMLVVVGTLLDIFNIYDKVVKIVGGGAMVPIISFGHLLAHGVIAGIHKQGILGLFTGMFTYVSAGIVAAIVFSFMCAVIFNPKD